jgi:hypothetical protein
MRAYVVIHGETGQVVHTHVEPEDSRTREEDVLEHVDPTHDRAQLRVVRVEGEALAAEGRLHRFDPGSEKLQPTEDAPGFGGGSVQSAATPPPSARATYRRKERD